MLKIDFDEPCPHCPDGQPIYPQVGKTGLQHVEEEDAIWLRELIRKELGIGRRKP